MATGIRAGKAFVELGLGDKLTKGLKAAQRRLKAFGQSVTTIGRQLAKLGAVGLAAGLAAARSFAKAGDQLAKMSKRTGVSVEALSELAFAASQSGSSVENLETGFRRMQRAINDAGKGLKTQAEALEALGLTYEEIKDLSPEAQFKLLGDRLGKLVDPTEKAAVAMELFGRGGTALIPLFNQGAKGINALQDEARALGLTMSGEDAKAAEEFTDAMDKLWRSIRMVVFQIGAALAPALQKVVDWMTPIVKTIKEWVQANRPLIDMVLKLTVAVLAAGAAFIVLGKALVIVAAGLGLLLTPIGAVIAGVTAIAAVLVWAADGGVGALKWLGETFSWLKDRALATWTGIADALAAGDIALAAKVMWLSVKSAWLEGTNSLRTIWSGFLFASTTALAKFGNGAIIIWRRTMHLMNLEAIHMQKGFSMIVSGLGTVLGKFLLEFTTLSDEEKKIARASIDEQAKAGRNAIRKTFRIAKAAQEKSHNKSMKDAKELHDATIKQLEEQHKARVGATEDELVAARANLKAAIAAAAAKAKAARDAEPGAPDRPDLPGGPGDVPDFALPSLKGASKTTAGTFFAAAGQSLQGNKAVRIQQQQLAQLEQIRDNTRPDRQQDPTFT